MCYNTVPTFKQKRNSFVNECRTCPLIAVLIGNFIHFSTFVTYRRGNMLFNSASLEQILSIYIAKYAY